MTGWSPYSLLLLLLLLFSQSKNNFMSIWVGKTHQVNWRWKYIWIQLIKEKFFRPIFDSITWNNIWMGNKYGVSYVEEFINYHRLLWIYHFFSMEKFHHRKIISYRYWPWMDWNNKKKSFINHLIINTMINICYYHHSKIWWSNDEMNFIH